MINPDRTIRFVDNTLKESEEIKNQLKKAEKDLEDQLFFVNRNLSNIRFRIFEICGNIRRRLEVDFPKDWSLRVQEFENFICIDCLENVFQPDDVLLEHNKKVLERIVEYLETYKDDISGERKKHELLIEAERHLAEADRREAVVKFKEAGYKIEEIDRKRQEKKSK